MAQILAVDDSATMRKMVTLALNAAGHEVVCAEDGVEALEIGRRRHDIDLVIIDINMPRMNGIELIRELRALDDYRQAPLLVLSTESSPERKQEGRAAGATGWLVKPFDPQQLLFAIDHVLGHEAGRARPKENHH